jgi:hypothetical protein
VTGEAHEQGPGDAEPFAHQRREVAVALHPALRHGSQPTSCLLGQVEEEWQQDCPGQGGLPGEVQHGDGDEHEANDVGGDAGKGRRERQLGPVDVVGHPRDQRAGPDVGEEGDRQALHVRAEPGADGVHEALADPGRDVARQEAETDAGDLQGGDGQRQRRHQAAVPGQEAVVDDPLEEQRWQHHGDLLQHHDNEQHRDSRPERRREPGRPPRRSRAGAAARQVAACQVTGIAVRLGRR